MRVQLDATLDDFVDVATRCLARSKQIRKWRWDGLLTSGLMAWLAIYAFYPGPFAKKMLAGFIVAAVTACIYPFTIRKQPLLLAFIHLPFAQQSVVDFVNYAESKLVRMALSGCRLS